MTKQELVEAVLKESGNGDLSKKATEELVDAVFETIKKSIRKDKRFSYPSFGTWTMRKRKARTGRNPQTGEEIKIAASKTVAFKPAPAFKPKL